MSSQFRGNVRAYIRAFREPQIEQQPGEQLPLIPDSGGRIDVSAIRRSREALRAQVRHSESTRRCYDSHFRSFAAWCQQAGKSSLPASTDTVCLYCTWMLVEQRYRTSSAMTHMVAIADAHRRAGLPPPSLSEAYEILQAVRRQRHEYPLGKTALSVKHLVKTCLLALRGPDTNRARRDLAIVVFGFATGLRRSDIVKVRMEDISFRKEGIALKVRWEKNDPDGEGRTIGVWAGKRLCTDPVRVLKRWLEVRGQWDGPLFCLITRRDVILRQPIGVDRVVDAVKTAVARVGLDPCGYGGHSLRAGAMTASADRGRTDRELMRFGGHRNHESVQPYIRESEVFSNRNPLPDVL